MHGRNRRKCIIINKKEEAKNKTLGDEMCEKKYSHNMVEYSTEKTAGSSPGVICDAMAMRFDQLGSRE